MKKSELKDGIPYKKVPKSGHTSGLVITDAIKGCKLNIYATGVEIQDGKALLEPIMSKIHEIDFDKIKEIYPDALFFTIKLEHPDDSDYIQAKEYYED